MRRAGLWGIDLGLIGLGVFGAVLLREDLSISSEMFSRYRLYFAVTMAIAVLLLSTVRLHRSSWRFVSMPDFMRLVLATGAIVLGAVLVTFAIDRLQGVGRSIPLIQFGLTASLLVSVRLAYRDYRARRSGLISVAPSEPLQSAEQILVIGINPIADLYVNCVRTYAANRTVVAGVISEKSQVSEGRSAFGVPILGTVADLDRIIAELEVHGIFLSRVVVTTDPAELHQSHHDVLEQLGSRSTLEIDYLAYRKSFGEFGRQAPPSPSASQNDGSDVDAPDVRMYRCDGLEATLRRPYWVMRRGVDVALAFALLAVAALPMLIIAVVVAARIGMPVVFWQYRPGRMGKEFRLYKFRTMLRPLTSDGHRIPDDERHSDLGSFLRRYRLDELPQLYNILRGDMSFVGPRPLLLSEQVGYPAARALVRPGLTGWAQVNGGRTVSPADKVVLDLWYIKNAGWSVDARIFLQTLEMIRRGDEVQPDAIRRAWIEMGQRPLSHQPV